MGAALIAAIAILIRRLALRTRSRDEAIGQEGAGLSVVKLGHLSLFDQLGLSQCGPNLLAYFAGFRAVGAAVVVELDLEAAEIGHVGLLHLGDQFFLTDALLTGTDHDGRAVRVVGTDVHAPPATKLLEADPDVGLQVLHQVADVNRGRWHTAGHW